MQTSFFKNSFVQVMLISMALLLGAPAHAQEAAPYTHVIVFGDSLSDVGNNRWSSDPPYQGSPITNANAAGQRWLWVEYFVDHLHLADGQVHPSSLATGLDPNQNNIDYAWAGSQTGDYYIDRTAHPVQELSSETCPSPGFHNGHLCDPGLLMQVHYFLKQVNGHPSPDGLYFLWSGSNDIYDNIAIVEKIEKDHSHWLQRLWGISYNEVGHIKSAVVDLEKAGVPANHIIVMNLADSSYTPAAKIIRKTLPKDQAEQVLASLHALVEGGTIPGKWPIHLKGINPKLKIALAELGENQPRLIDISDEFLKLISSKKDFDKVFTNVTDSCVADDALTTKHCNGYIFFNEVHPTTQTDEVIADYIGSETHFFK